MRLASVIVCVYLISFDVVRPAVMVQLALQPRATFLSLRPE
jgi:hypothetical protein